jgi:hypothetical protein
MILLRAQRAVLFAQTLAQADQLSDLALKPSQVIFWFCGSRGMLHIAAI